MAGFLPYLVLQEIFTNIEENSSHQLETLHSCILVNRYWCRHAMPYLWRRPFDCRYEKYPQLFQTYLQFIQPPEMDLVGVDIAIPTSEKPPLFEYPSFIKHLHFGYLNDVVQRWLVTEGDLKKGKNKQTWKPQWFHRETPITHEHFYIIKRAFVHALLESFIGSSARLQTIHFSASGGKETNPEGILWSLESNVSALIAPVPGLSISGMFSKDDLFLQLSKVCRKVKNMSITMEGNPERWGVQYATEYDHLNLLIAAQGGLQSLSLSLREKSRDFMSTILPSVWRHAETLRNLNFYTADLRDVKPLAGLASCKHLETLEFRYCKGLNEELVSPFISATHPKLRRVRVLGGCCQKLSTWANARNQAS